MSKVSTSDEKEISFFRRRLVVRSVYRFSTALQKQNRVMANKKNPATNPPRRKRKCETGSKTTSTHVQSVFRWRQLRLITA
jgi:hypothetical protein